MQPPPAGITLNEAQVPRGQRLVVSPPTYTGRTFIGGREVVPVTCQSLHDLTVEIPNTVHIQLGSNPKLSLSPSIVTGHAESNKKLHIPGRTPISTNSALCSPEPGQLPKTNARYNTKQNARGAIPCKTTVVCAADIPVWLFCADGDKSFPPFRLPGFSVTLVDEDTASSEGYGLARMHPSISTVFPSPIS